MILTWYITDDISNITPQEFDSEWNGVYELGFLPKSGSSLEGNYDILFWITKLIEIGINAFYKKDFKFQLLSYNQLYIDTQYDDMINFRLIEKQTRKVLSSNKLSYNDMINETIENVKNFKLYIDDKNDKLKYSNTIKNFENIYNNFLEIYHINN